jgi:hypothetical protein
MLIEVRVTAPSGVRMSVSTPLVTPVTPVTLA